MQNADDLFRFLRVCANETTCNMDSCSYVYKLRARFHPTPHGVHPATEYGYRGITICMSWMELDLIPSWTPI
jgi:hypothetical protein